MKRILGKVKEGISKTPESIKNTYGDAVDKLNGGLKKIGDMGSGAKEKVLNFANEIISILPILEEFGYKTTEFRVGISIPPTVEMDVLKIEDLDEATYNKKLDDYHAKMMFVLILKALESAKSIQDKLPIGDDYHHEFSLQITIPPNVGVKYRLKEMTNDITLIEK
ncbi:MAG: hypothetical protein JXR07_08690 [Reichenbachiella sp.]